MAAKESTTLAHQTVPREGTARLPHVSFVCCLAVSTNRKPTVHAGCIRHKPRQQVVVRFHFHTRRADSAASFMHFEDVTDLSAAPLNCGSPSAEVSCTTSPARTIHTALRNARMEDLLSHRNTTMWLPKMSTSFTIIFTTFSQLGKSTPFAESSERKFTWSLHRASPELDCLHAVQPQPR